MKSPRQTDTATSLLAGWCSSVDADWDPTALSRASDAFIDTIAVMLAGTGHDSQATFASAVLELNGAQGEATVVARETHAAAPWAALINGCAAHQLDFDDVFDPSMSHPSAVLVPAILALGQSKRKSGKDCLDAYIVGLEVLARLGEAMNLAHYANGWHATSTLGTMAAAGACARLLCLNTRQTQMAISLASSMSGGSKCQFGTLAKPMHAGMAAKNGIIAAHLASHGTEAIDEPLEGAWGYMALTCGSEAPGFDQVLPKLGKHPAILEHGISIKLYPCCSSTHRPVDALLAARKRQSFSTADVARIEVHISDIAARNLRYHYPQTPAQARFSLEYCLAVTLQHDKGPQLSDFTEDAVLDPAIQSLLPLMEIHTDTQLAARGPVGQAPDRIQLFVHLHNGTTLSQSMEHPRGHPLNPIDQDTLRDKFHACVSGKMQPQQTEHLWLLLSDLESSPDIQEIMAML